MSSDDEGDDEIEKLLNDEFENSSTDNESDTCNVSHGKKQLPTERDSFNSRDTDLTFSTKKRQKNEDSKSCPPHPGTMGGICIRSEGLARTSGSNKLVCVLDLDHTLLNSCSFNELPPSMEPLLWQILEEEKANGGQMLFRAPNLGLWTKLRPFVREFLDRLQTISELYIYTHGDKTYAREMAKLLDPQNKLFNGRIISKHVTYIINTGDESSVLIVDDTHSVWPQHKKNLIVVERYIFFPLDAVRFQISSSLLELQSDEDPALGQLQVALNVIEDIHSSLFNGGSNLDQRDVRILLKERRSSILKGVTICFTKIIPLHTNYLENPLWLLALELGASCVIDISPDVTHVVAGSLNTDKAALASTLGIPILNQHWLFACGFSWSRAPEVDFLFAHGLQGQHSKKSIIKKMVTEEDNTTEVDGISLSSKSKLKATISSLQTSKILSPEEELKAASSAAGRVNADSE